MLNNLFRWRPNMVKSEEEIDVYDNETPYVYVLVRKDLPAIKKLIQASHACLEAGFVFKPIPGKTCHLVIMEVKKQEDLKRIFYELRDDQYINSCMFFEPDFDLGFTVLATEPLIGEKRKFFKKFKLLKVPSFF